MKTNGALLGNLISSVSAQKEQQQQNQTNIFNSSAITNASNTNMSFNYMVN